MHQAYHWQIAPQVPERRLSEFRDLSPLVVQLLYNRGLTEPDAAQAFLAAEWLPDNPFRLHGMNDAVGRIRQAIASGEPVAVYGDFDADGVTATAVLVETLEALGADVRPYIPHRVDEGYGLNHGSLKVLAGRGSRLLVTVDCGIRATPEIRYANRLGLDVIVTDHHSVPPRLPPALAVVNPKQPECPYPFQDLAGSGLAFKLSQGLLRSQARVPLPRARRELAEVELLDLVALGTVADVVPLVGENRALVRRGLEVLNEARRLGVQALMARADVRPGAVDAETIGYVLGPRLNAAGRLEHAITSYRLLTTDSPAEAERLAAKLEEHNRRRQELTEATVEGAREQVQGQLPEQKLLFASSDDFVEGVVGLAASRLTSEFYRPSVVVVRGRDESRGSARSIPEFSVVAAFDQCQDLLTRHGGHAAAAGFTAPTENLRRLASRLHEIAAEALADVDLVPVLEVDAEVPLDQLTWDTQVLLQELAPFGVGNPVPLLLSRDVRVRAYRVVGDDHLKLTLDDGRIAWDAIAFRQGAWAESLPARVDLVYSLDVNEWSGEVRLQLNVKDLRPAHGAGA